MSAVPFCEQLREQHGVVRLTTFLTTGTSTTSDLLQPVGTKGQLHSLTSQVEVVMKKIQTKDVAEVYPYHACFTE